MSDVGIDKITADLVNEHLAKIESERTLKGSKEAYELLQQSHRVFLMDIVYTISDGQNSKQSQLTDIKRRCQQVIDNLKRAEKLT